MAFVAFALCLHLQGSEAFSSVAPLRSLRDPVLPTQLRAKRTSILGSSVSGLRARATLGGRLLRTDIAALKTAPDQRGFALARKVDRFGGGGRSSTSATALQGWVGTGVYLYSKWQVSFGLNSVLAGLMFLSKKYEKMLTTAGLFHAWILGVVLWGSLGPGGWATGAFYLAAGSR
eukprot:258336-Rhodomonas_salina.2